MGVLAWFVGWRLAPASRRGLLATSLFSNAANIMLPVTLFAFGEEGLQRALILYVFSAVMLFTAGPIVLGGVGMASGRERATARAMASTRAAGAERSGTWRACR